MLLFTLTMTPLSDVSEKALAMVDYSYSREWRLLNLCNAPSLQNRYMHVNTMPANRQANWSHDCRMPIALSGLCLVCLPLRTSLATEKESPSPLLVPCLESNEAKTAETREQDVTTVLQCLGGKSDGYMTWAGLVNFSLTTSESMRCAATSSDGFCLSSTPSVDARRLFIASNIRSRILY